MADRGAFDGRFSLPAVDASPSAETGVILMGLDRERLLAGLGLAALAGRPARVVLAVDQARHGALHLTMDELIDAGLDVWRSVRPGLARTAGDTATPASLRNAWTRTYEAIATADAGGLGPAGYAYLTACWLRRTDIDA